MSTIRVVNLQHTDATEPNIVLLADGTSVFASGITISGGTNLTVSGTAEFASGTVSAPGITFIDDNNTGLYSPATDTVAITTAATERLRIDSAGQVGIGTSSPARTLHVRKDAAYALKVGGESGAAFYLELGQPGASASPGINYTGTNASLRFLNNGSDVARFDSSGNFGIGTSSPRGKLEVSDGTSNTAGEAINEAYIVGATTGSTEGILTIQSNNGMASDKGGSIAFGGRAVTGSSAGANWAFINGYKENGTTANYGGYLSFATRPNSGAINERMRITSDGKFGFNTTNPGAFDSGANNFVVLGNNSGTGNSGITIASGNDSYGNIYFGDGTGAASYKGFIAYNHNGNTLRFGTDGTERMRIDSSGSVGIGTSSPSQRFHVLTQGTAGGIIAQFENNDSGNYGGLRILGGITDRECRFQSLFGSSSFTFYTEGTSAALERMRITSQGATIFAAGSASGSGGSSLINNNDVGFVNDSSFGQTLHLGNTYGGAKGYVLFLYNSTTAAVGSITANGPASGTATGVSFNDLSDYRVKENVVDITDGITRVKQLQPRRYNFIADADTTVDGFIAHEAQAVVPQAVIGTKDEVDDNGDPVLQQIDRSKLVPLLTAALQEAIAKIETLEQRLSDAGIV